MMVLNINRNRCGKLLTWLSLPGTGRPRALSQIDTYCLSMENYCLPLGIVILLPYYLTMDATVNATVNRTV